jgi:hypothetical protein
MTTIYKNKGWRAIGTCVGPMRVWGKKTLISIVEECIDVRGNEI